MNKTAIKNFAIWARVQLIQDVSTKAAYFGITEKGFEDTNKVGDVIMLQNHSGKAVILSAHEAFVREKFISKIKELSVGSNIKTAYQSVVEEIAYTWFNRIVAIRFMEVNGYLPSRTKVLSSDTVGKNEPDIVTHPEDAELNLSSADNDYIYGLKLDNKQDELFKYLFIKQCNALNEYLPELFEKFDDYSEMFIDLKYTDTDSVVRRVVTDIDEQDFMEAVEIIGWMYQYYNTAPKQDVFDNLKKNIKISKENIPAATQLFTPDWIVRYMIENSLGKKYIDYLKTKKQYDKVSSLKSKWKYFIDSEEFEFISSFDISTITVIDPCMGSGHILVYAFEVLMDIYRDLGYVEREIPVLILKNSLFGLDIDKRAYQLSYFAVMMMARKYDRTFLKTKKIKELHLSNFIESNGLSNIGEELLNFKTAKFTHEQADLADYLVRIFTNGMTYGSALIVDPADYDGLKNALSTAVSSTVVDIVESGVINTIFPLLIKMCKIAKLLSDKYDVVCTNPPYMGSSGMDSKLSQYVKDNYPNSKSDLFAVFIEKCIELTKKQGFTAMITMHSWMFLSSFEKLRTNIVNTKNISSMAHLGARAFEEIGGEVVQTTAFVLGNKASNNIGNYFRLIDFNSQDSKEQAFLQAINYNNCKYKFTASAENFAKIPGSPIAYWVSERIYQIFEEGINISNFIDSFQGIITGDNNKFLRYWQELNITKIALHKSSFRQFNLTEQYWIPYNKGGEFRKWYGNQDYVVNWKNGAKDKTRGKESFNAYYLREYVSWSYITSSTLATRYFPDGFLWDVSGSGVFDKKNSLSYIQSLMSSPVAVELLNIINPTINYQVENILQLPIIFDEKKKPRIDELVEQNIELSKTDWDSFETSWDFKKHPLVITPLERKEQFDAGMNSEERRAYVCNLNLIYDRWQNECEYRFNTLKKNEEELNRIFIDIYDLQDELTPEVEDKAITVRKADLKRDVKSLISYAVGCMFGRYTLDVDGLAYAGGDWDSSKYSSFIPDADNVLPITDDEYLDNDIVTRFVKFVEVVYGADTLEKNLNFIAQALGNKGETSRKIIRNYFLNDFYNDHVKMYQKRPIYWQLDSGKNNGFKALIYMHRYNEDTMGFARIDYLHKLQRIYESTLNRMDDIIDANRNSRDVAEARKKKDILIKQLQETRDYDMVLGHIALQRIVIDLDDGVKVNYAKFQYVEVSTGEGKKPVKMNILTKIG